jgi:hypothetical protein
LKQNVLPVKVDSNVIEIFLQGGSCPVLGAAAQGLTNIASYFQGVLFFQSKVTTLGLATFGDGGFFLLPTHCCHRI